MLERPGVGLAVQQMSTEHVKLDTKLQFVLKYNIGPLGVLRAESPSPSEGRP